MKIFSKKSFQKVNLLVVLVFTAAFLVRFYNFPNRITFWTEQAKSLIVAADYLKKPSLLGQEYFRQDINGHKIFSGALFNYTLTPFYLLTKGDPNLITAYFGFLNIFTGYVLFIISKKTLGTKVAILSTILFLFNAFMIYHSLFIWNYNYLPLIGILTTFFLWRFFKQGEIKDIFWIGLLSGIGVSLQILYAPIALIIFGISVWKSKKKLKYLLVFALSAVLGNLPMVIFDLRHDFYQIKTLLQYLVDTLNGASDAELTYYYFLPFWPITSIVVARFLARIKNHFIILILLVYILINLKSSLVNLDSPTGMPKGIVLQDINLAGRKIAEDADNNFNVAEVLDFDKRAYVLRYYVAYKYGKNPLGETEYQNPQTLYVLSQKDYNFKNSDIWEINAGGPYNVSELIGVGGDYAIYKLQK